MPGGKAVRLPALLAILLLAGCGYYDARAARDPLTSPLIGMGFPDLVHCMGPWDSWHQIDRDVFDVTWGHTDSSAALKMSIAVLGSISVGGSGGCKANVTVLRDGTVAGVNFPQSYANGLLTAPYGACAPLVSERLQHHDETGRSAGYDIGVYLAPGIAAADARKK